jgi:mRNA interferase RelE/StbE
VPYEIRWDEKARDFLRTIHESDAKRIVEKVNSIVHFPEHYLESLSGVKSYKLRVGDYRIIVDLDRNNKTILVLFIGHRKNIYDQI